MTYAMTLDNSWEIMCEEEMYDINGGTSTTFINNISGLYYGYVEFRNAIIFTGVATIGGMIAWAQFGFWYTLAHFGAVGAIIGSLGTPAVAIIAVLSTAAMVTALWNIRMFY